MVAEGTEILPPKEGEEDENIQNENHESITSVAENENCTEEDEDKRAGLPKHQTTRWYSDTEIFDVLTSTQKQYILWTGSLVALITPFTDTVYLPALTSVAIDLSASTDDVGATVSAYMAAVGLGQLIWGPLSDRFGRVPVLFSALIGYLLFTIACAFAPEIRSLIVFRTFEGFIVGCTLVSTQAIIADIYAPAERGAAMGSFLAPMLVGPIIAPLVGGALSDAFSWRSTFLLLLVMTFFITILAWYMIPETHHYFVSKSHPNLSKLNVPKPVLISPFTALEFLLDRELVPHFCVLATTFAGMFTSLTILPPYLAQAPYNLSPSIIGVCFLPVGVAMLLGALTGGQLSDLAAVRYNKDPAGRLVYSMIGVLLCVVAGIAFGFSLQYSAHPAAVLITQSVLGFGQAFYMPANLGFLSSVRQSSAAAVGAVAMFVCFAAAAVSISISIILSQVIGIDMYYIILAGLTVISDAWASSIIYHRVVVSVDALASLEKLAVKNDTHSNSVYSLV